MSELPSISIVTPSFNQAQYLEQTIASVLTQDYPNVEYLVYDGGSTDGSVDIIRKYAGKLAGWRSGPDKGQTDAIVQGWQAATGDVVAWLNSDDYYLPGALAKVAEAFRGNPEAQVVIGTCLLVNAHGSVVGEKYARNFNLPVMLSTSGGVPGQPAVFLRRELIEKTGYPDPELHYVMDWEYWIRLSLQLAPYQVHVLYKPLCAVRIWPGTKTLTGIEAICEEHRRVLTRLFASGALPPEAQALKETAMAGAYFKQTVLEWRAGRTRAAWRSLSKARSLSLSGLTLWQVFLSHIRIWMPYSVYEGLRPVWRWIRSPVARSDRLAPHDRSFIAEWHMKGNLRAQLAKWIGASPLRRMLANSSMLLGAESLATLISLVQFPIITRMLGPANYGAWGIATSWVAIVAQIISFRLWETVIRFLSRFIAADDEPRALAFLKLCLWIDVLVAVVTLVVVSASAGLAASFILHARPDGADLIRLEALDVFAGLSMSVWMAVLRTFNRFRDISIYNIGSAVAIFVGWMTMLYLHTGVSGLIFITAVIKLGQTLTLAALARRDLKARFRDNWWAADLALLRPQRREIWVMLFSMNIDTFRKIVLNNVDLVVLGWLTTPAQAGIYRLAEQLAAYVNRLINPIYDTLYPEVARLYAGEGPAAVAALVRRLQRGVLIAFGVGAAAAFLILPCVLPWLFGRQFGQALPVFFILILANVWVLGLWVPAVMLAAGRAKHLTVINTLSSLVMLVLLFILVPFFGAKGAAVAQTTFQFVWLALSYPVARRLLAKPPTKAA